METIIGIIGFILALIIVVSLFAYYVRIIPQAKAFVIERLGAYHTTWHTGIHILLSLIHI